MDHAQAISEIVAANLSQLGLDADASALSRTVLIQDGYFVGYQFYGGDMRAVWFADSDVLKFHSADGTLVRKVNLAERVKKVA